MLLLLKLLVVATFIVGALLLVWRTQHGWRFVLGALLGPLMWGMALKAAVRINSTLAEFGKLTAPRKGVRFQRGAGTTVVQFRGGSPADIRLSGPSVKTGHIPKGYPQTLVHVELMQGRFVTNRLCDFSMRRDPPSLPGGLTRLPLQFDPDTCQAVMYYFDWRTHRDSLGALDRQWGGFVHKTSPSA